MAAPAPKMATHVLMAALRAHYVKPVAAADRTLAAVGESDLLVEEVAAPGTSRRCDLLRLGMWPSRGMEVDVHELKTSRGDFQRELDDPAKAEAWWPYCHRFWIVAPAGLIDPAEVPAGWGLMVPPAASRHRRFRVVKEAAVKEPKLTVPFLVEVAKRVDNARLAEIGQLNQTHREALYRARQEERRRQAEERLSADVKSRLEVLEKLEKALGVPLASESWFSADGTLRRIGGAELGEAMADYLLGHVRLQDKRERLDQYVGMLQRSTGRFLENLGRLDAEGDDST